MVNIIEMCRLLDLVKIGYVKSFELVGVSKVDKNYYSVIVTLKDNTKDEYWIEIE